MFKFNSPVISDYIWSLQFKTKEEMIELFFENKEPDEDVRIHGITEYLTSTIYIDKELSGFNLIKAIRHEVMHIYLWETGQQDRTYTEEEVCDLMSIAGPLVCQTADNIVLELKKKSLIEDK